MKIPGRPVAAALLLSCALTGHAQTKYPVRPIRIVVPLAPGGGSDVLARMLSPRLSERLGQPVIVDNRPAASGVLGADIVAKSAADGYTLMVTTPTFVISSALRTGLPYHVLKDFTPLTLIISTPFGLLVNPKLPATSVKELVALARASPGKLLYGSSGPGSSPHLVTELFSSMTGISMTHIPYKGIGLANTALIANEVQVVFSNMFSTRGHWQAGRLRLVAHAGSQRRDGIPQVPTIAESGVPGFEAYNWYGAALPAGASRAIVDRLYQEFAAVCSLPEIRKTLTEQLNDVIVSKPEEFAKTIRSDYDKWGRIGRQLGVKFN